MIDDAVGLGGDLFTIWQWTWGETLAFIKARHEAQRHKMQDEAAVAFRTASVLTRMVTADRGTKFQLMDEYPFLWTEEERKQARVAAILADMEAQNARIRAAKRAREAAANTETEQGAAT